MLSINFQQATVSKILIFWSTPKVQPEKWSPKLFADTITGSSFNLACLLPISQARCPGNQQKSSVEPHLSRCRSSHYHASSEMQTSLKPAWDGWVVWYGWVGSILVKPNVRPGEFEMGIWGIWNKEEHLISKKIETCIHSCWARCWKPNIRPREFQAGKWEGTWYTSPSAMCCAKIPTEYVLNYVEFFLGTVIQRK